MTAEEIETMEELAGIMEALEYLKDRASGTGKHDTARKLTNVINAIQQFSEEEILEVALYI